MKVIITDAISPKTEILFESKIDKFVVNSNGITDFVLNDKIVLSLDWSPGRQYVDYVMYGKQLAYVDIVWNE